MKPKPKPGDEADVVLYFDANMPEVLECRRGCGTDAKRMCLHRFGPRIRLILQQDRISFTRLTDLQVILDFLHIIQRRWGMHTKVHRKRYVIATHDKTFLIAARREHEDARNMQRLPLVWDRDSVTFQPRRVKRRRKRGGARLPKAIRVEVHTIPAGSDRHEQDLRCVLEYARQIRRAS